MINTAKLRSARWASPAAVRCALAVTLLSTLPALPLRGQVITPRLAWPTNTVADIEGFAYTLSRSALKNDSTGYAMTSRLEVRAHPDGLLVMQGPSTGGPPASALAGMAPSMDAMNRVITRMIVGPTGQFIRMDDDGQSARQMDSAMAPMIELMRKTSPELAERMIATRAAAASNANKGQQWLALGGRLFGRSWAHRR